MHYAVIDEEFCMVPWGSHAEGYPYKHEIIQVGIVLLDENYNETGRFSEYVRPDYGRIERKIKELTGIAQESLNGSLPLSEVINRLKAWLPEDVTMVSWGYDDRRQLVKEAKIKGIDIAWLQPLLDGWADCQRLFSTEVGDKKQYSLEEAILMAGLDAEGRLHDGLSDAANTATIFRMLKTGGGMEKCRKYINAKTTQTPITFTLGDILSRMMTGTDGTI
jgi:inhibitor of KinA sporulation pathway (predicted exonuclease)